MLKFRENDERKGALLTDGPLAYFPFLGCESAHYYPDIHSLLCVHYMRNKYRYIMVLKEKSERI